MAKKPKQAKVEGARLEQAMPSPSKLEHDDPINNYEVKGHLQTLMDAHEIMNNPEKMDKVHKLAGRHSKAIRGIQDIKDHYNSKYGGKNAALKGDGDGDEGAGQ